MPKLRFPGFEGEWSVYHLSDFTTRITRKNTGNESSLPLTISSKDGLVDQVTYFNKTVASKDMSGYYLLKNGEYAYNKSYSVGYDFGSIKRLDRYEMGALSTLYICFALTKHDSDFIKTYFDSLKWYKEIYMIAAEGARNHGLLNVPTDDFFATQHILPNNEQEQHKIAQFLGLLETRIEKQRQLVDALKSYKRGLIQRLWQRNISFVKQNDKWPEMRIDELFDCIIDKGHPEETVLTIIQGVGTVPRDSIDRRISYDKKSVSSYKKVIKDDFILHLRSFEGGLEISNETGIVSPAYTILRGKQKIVPHFFYTYFRSYPFIQDKLRIAVEGIRDGKSINMVSFWAIEIPVPPIDIQKQISDFISQLNKRIDIAISMLDSCEKVKRGLLSNLLI